MKFPASTALILLNLGCQETANRFQVIDLVEEEYQLTTRAIPTLEDASTMRGTLGNLYVGGVFRMDLTTLEMSYQGGHPPHIRYETQDSIAYPVDRDGLIAFSFYAHLEDTIALLETSEQDWTGILPVDTAISPVISDLSLAFLPFENAAYVPTMHHFIILTDAIEKEVPLASNKGVVGHEFGHSVFHFLTTGGTTTPRLLEDSTLGQQSLYSLDEGLADMMGFLVTRRPNFIADSLPDQDRALDAEHLAKNLDVLPSADTETTFLPSYDPYPLGSVFASCLWSIDQSIDDPTRMLNWFLATTQMFGEDVRMNIRPDSEVLGYEWLDVLVSLAQTETERSAACEHIQKHFDTVYEVLECRM